MTFTDEELEVARQAGRKALRMFYDRLGRLPNERELDVMAALSVSAAHRRMATDAPTATVQ